jgi:hypothetical protein
MGEENRRTGDGTVSTHLRRSSTSIFAARDSAWPASIRMVSTLALKSSSSGMIWGGQWGSGRKDWGRGA